MRKLNNQGVGHIVSIVLLLVLIGIATVGYRVAHNSDANEINTASEPAAIVVPGTIDSKADVQQADRALDNSGIDGSVDPSTLDQDINSLL